MSAAPKIKEELKYRIEVMTGPHQGLKIQFGKPSVFIGRGPENDIVLANDPRVSRQHAEIKLHGQEFVVVNLSLKNLVLLNGQKIQSETLSAGSVITVGESEIHFFPEHQMPGSENLAKPVAAGSVTPILKPVGRNSVPSLTQSHAPSYTPPNSAAVPPQHQSIPMYQSPSAGSGGGRGNMGARPRATAGPRSSGGLFENPRVRFYAISETVD